MQVEIDYGEEDDESIRALVKKSVRSQVKQQEIPPERQIVSGRTWPSIYQMSTATPPIERVYASFWVRCKESFLHLLSYYGIHFSKERSF